MQKVMFQTAMNKSGAERAEELFRYGERVAHGRTDRLLAKLMVFQWLAAIAAALWLSPKTWIDAGSSTHVWASVFLVGAIAALPVSWAFTRPGRTTTRHGLAVAQALFSALLIHLTGGRIETHFHVFGSLVLLSFYRDWRVLVTATVVVAIDLALRGMFWPQSIFGVLSVNHWRWLEHAGWVIFEDVFLIISIRQSVKKMQEAALRRSHLEVSERRLEQAQRVARVGSWEWDLARNTMIWSSEQYRLLGLSPDTAEPSWERQLSCAHPDQQPAVAAWIRTVRETQDSGRLNYRVVHPNGQERILHCRADVVLDQKGEVVRLVGISQDITDRQRAEDFIRTSEVKFRTITQSVGEAIISTDARGHILLWNRAAELIFGYPEEEMVGRSITCLVPLRDRAATLVTWTAERPGTDDGEQQFRLELDGLKKDGTEFPIGLTLSHWETTEGRFCTGIVRDITRRKQAAEALRKANEDLELRVAQRTSELTTANVELQAEIAERKEAEAKLAALHKQLLESSRQAGMAEVATSVLHNVGNVLNSVNVSCSVLATAVQKSGLEYLSRTAAALEGQTHRLAEFMTLDPMGRKLPSFLTALAGRLQAEQTTLLAELAALTQNVDHIKEIVAMQQSYGRVSGVTDVVKLADLVEDSLRMNSGALKRHAVEATREYEENAPLKVEKHKVLQILVNVIRNAKYACDESGRTDKHLTVRVQRHGEKMRVSVADNGVGIAPENLTRIFSLGFTTRADGHGYGLHSAALAAQEMGGSLTAHSDGPGTGATFTLELPLEPPHPNL